MGLQMEWYGQAEASTSVWAFYHTIGVKRELSQKAKQLISLSLSLYIPTHNHCHEMWVVILKIRSHIQVSRVKFPYMVAWLYLRNMVKSLDIRKEPGEVAQAFLWRLIDVSFWGYSGQVGVALLHLLYYQASMAGVLNTWAVDQWQAMDHFFFFFK